MRGLGSGFSTSTELERSDSESDEDEESAAPSSSRSVKEEAEEGAGDGERSAFISGFVWDGIVVVVCRVDGFANRFLRARRWTGPGAAIHRTDLFKLPI